MRAGLIVAVAAVVAGLLPGGAPALASAQKEAPAAAPAITWATCGDDLKGNALECTTVEVPLDYARPDGPMISLGLTRLRMPTASEDVVFFNGGGPGIAGGALLRVSATPVPRAVAQRFTVIAIDPRGLGDSDRLKCLTSDFARRTLTALTEPVSSEADLRRDWRVMRALGATCLRDGGALARHVSSELNARDMESVRLALGLPALNYIGVSYGTYLGATYSHLFPTSVGRMVLGAVVHPGRTWTQLVRAQVRGFEGTVRRWATTCENRSTCPYAGRSAYRRVADLIARLNAAPVTVNGMRYTGNSIALGLRELAFGGASMKEIDRYVRSTLASIRSASARTARVDSGVTESLIAVQWATRCTDWPDRSETFAQWSDRRERWSRTFPVFGAMWAVLTVPCTSWPGRPADVADLTQSTDTPLLLIAGEHDPATPIAGARAMADLFSDARLVRWGGRGHGAIESGDCDRIITAYLVRGALPAPGSRC